MYYGKQNYIATVDNKSMHQTYLVPLRISFFYIINLKRIFIFINEKLLSLVDHIKQGCVVFITRAVMTLSKLTEESTPQKIDLEINHLQILTYITRIRY